ncbi:hypothetical protein CMI48_03525 [Candidatus Pacearchaeota archaeon]|jgi:hypothetical protein|nr:hypothetical protein [Candidatus Pacearchaeota archaeon]
MTPEVMGCAYERQRDTLNRARSLVIAGNNEMAAGYIAIEMGHAREVVGDPALAREIELEGMKILRNQPAQLRGYVITGERAA